jgi:hypothetical protein
VVEAEESPLLETVTRGRLVKRQQAGKSLAGAVVICKLWRLMVTHNSSRQPSSLAQVGWHLNSVWWMERRTSTSTSSWSIGYD